MPHIPPCEKACFAPRYMVFRTSIAYLRRLESLAIATRKMPNGKWKSGFCRSEGAKRRWRALFRPKSRHNFFTKYLNIHHNHWPRRSLCPDARLARHFGHWAHRVAPLTTISRHEEHRSPHLHDQTDKPQPICRDRARKQQLRLQSRIGSWET